MDQVNSPKKRPSRRRLWLVGALLGLTIIVLVFLFAISGINGQGISALGNNRDQEAANPQPDDVVITANPVDLSTIVAITKFRSCFGHEFGFTSAFEGKEAKCSLKHYFVPADKYLGTKDAVPVYAPFNGRIILTEIGTDQFLIQQEPFAGWVFTFTHVVVLPDLEMGSPVRAGQLIGHAELIKTHAFDLSLQAKMVSSYGKEYDWVNLYDSIFQHMSSEVFAQYLAKGVTKEKIIILKSIRDANPCLCDPSNLPPANSPYCNFYPISFMDLNNAVLLN